MSSLRLWSLGHARSGKASIRHVVPSRWRKITATRHLPHSPPAVSVPFFLHWAIHSTNSSAKPRTHWSSCRGTDSSSTDFPRQSRSRGLCAEERRSSAPSTMVHSRSAPSRSASRINPRAPTWNVSTGSESSRRASSPGLSHFPLEKAECHFYAGLSRAARCEPVGPDPYAKHREALGAHERQLRAWAVNCPENFEDRAALVGAEIARIEGRPLDAMDLYERAIASARANGFAHNEALANELAARFYAARRLEEVAPHYLGNARQGYLRWGAEGKVRQLDHLHPRLRQDERAPRPTGTIEAPIEQLDLATVIEVSQALSGEMALEKLIDKLMRAAIEQAGAE